jgi:phosphoglycolate phosphatase-like HAD superfamily hydrolase
MLVVFDLDGTLADCRHRLHFIQQDKPDWDAFYAACKCDTSLQPAIEVFRALSLLKGYEVQIWTGRAERTREATNRWLASRDILPNLLRMRPDDDHRPDHELKQDWLFDAVREFRHPALVFEDRQRVVDMWRRNLVTCFQVAKGDY